MGERDLIHCTTYASNVNEEEREREKKTNFPQVCKLSLELIESEEEREGMRDPFSDKRIIIEGKFL